MAEPEQITRCVDYTARGQAAEAIQALRSHEQLNNLQLENMEHKHTEIKELIEATNKKIDDGFRAYDAKFWGLAITIIMGLMTIICALIFKLLFPH